MLSVERARKRKRAGEGMLLTSGQTRNSKETHRGSWLAPEGATDRGGMMAGPVAERHRDMAGPPEKTTVGRGVGRSRVSWLRVCRRQGSQGHGQGMRAHLQPPLGRGTHLLPRRVVESRCVVDRRKLHDGWPRRAPLTGGG